MRHLATLMGGEIGVASALGRGSEFWVQVPYAFDDAARELERAADLRPFEVLVADDDPDARNTLSSAARALGWRVEVVDSGEGAIGRTLERAATDKPIDVLLLDWRMPDVNGLQVMQRLAERLGEAQRPGTVIVSAYEVGHSELADVMLSKSKPVTASSLFNAVNAAVVHRGRGYAQLVRSTRLESISSQLLPGVRVLVVDDSEINLEVARRILERDGACVTICNNGVEALARLRAGPTDFDAVLMDVQMPVMDGHEATRQLRAEPALRRLPVIALTAGALVLERQRALDNGMSAFIAKPVDPAVLVRTVRREVELATGSALSVRPRHASTSIASQWPVIDGIDGHATFSRFGGDVAQFTILLGRMLDECDSLAKSALPTDATQQQALALQMHKLRGTAGAMGADDIRLLAGKAESALQADVPGPDTEACMLALRQAFAALRRHAQPVLDAHTVPVDLPTDETAEPIDPSAIRTLVDLLQQQDVSARAHFLELAGPLAGVLGRERFQSLRSAVDSFQFGEALQVLEQEARWSR